MGSLSSYQQGVRPILLPFPGRVLAFPWDPAFTRPFPGPRKQTPT